MHEFLYYQKEALEKFLKLKIFKENITLKKYLYIKNFEYYIYLFIFHFDIIILFLLLIKKKKK